MKENLQQTFEPGVVICKNCGNRFSGNYCNMCRQPADTHRITWKEMLHQLLHAFFHADKGLFFTIKELFFRPGITIREYIQGKRINHFNPILFLILAGGIATLLFFTTGLRPPNETVELNKIERLSSTLAHKYFIAVGVLFIILLTVTDYFFYFKRKYDLPEIITSNAFQSGQLLVYVILLLPFLLLQNFLIQQWGVNINMRWLIKVITLFFLFYTRYQLYYESGKFWLILKIILQLALVYLLYNLLVDELVEYMQK